MPICTVTNQIDPFRFLDEVLALYYPGGGATYQEIYQATEPAETCTDGWTFDDSANPTTIELCSATCAQVQADPLARVEIEIGCYEIG